MRLIVLMILAILDDTAKVVQLKGDCKENRNYFGAMADFATV
jgi:hypothetical protein